MPRISKGVLHQQARRTAADSIAKLVERKGKPRRTPPKVLEEQVVEMIKSGDWSSASARHMVALYCWCHNRVYNVRAAELEDRSKPARQARMGAESAARRMLEQEFRNDAGAMATFIRWVWRRELNRLTTAKQQQREIQRIGWKLMFCYRQLLGDYMVNARAARSA